MKITYKADKNKFYDEVRYLQEFLVRNKFLSVEDSQSEYGYYKLKTEKAYKLYQKEKGWTADGIYDTSKQVDFDVNGNDVIVGDNSGTIGVYVPSTSNDADNSNTDTKSQPFFNDYKENVFRKGNLNIEINYSNSITQKRIITGVKLRSLGQSIDANGEAIADVYEFVGKDIIENEGGTTLV